MTINSSNRVAGPYLGNSVTTNFGFSFKVFSSADLQIVQTDPTGAETILTSGFTVSLNSDQDANPGGSITLTTALVTGYKLTLTSSISATQATDLTNQGGFYPKVITNALDKLTILIQQLFGLTSRQVTAPISDGTVNFTLPAAASRASKLLGFSSDGMSLVVADPGGQYDSTLRADLANAITAGKGNEIIAYRRTAAEIAALVTPVNPYQVSDSSFAGVSMERQGAVGDGTTNDTTALTNAAAVAGFNGGIRSLQKTYRVGDVVLQSRNVDLGFGTWKATVGATAVFKPDTSGLWRFSKIANGQIDGNSRASAGIKFNQVYAGRLVLNCVEFINCDKAIYKPQGNIGVKFYDVNVNTSNYGYYALSQTSPVLMHAGCDQWFGGNISGCDFAAIYIDSSASGTGQTIFDSTIIQYNAGFGVFIANYLGATNPLEFRNIWMEGNHTAGSVTVPAGTFTPRDWYILNASQVKIYGSDISSFYASASDLIFEQCENYAATYGFTVVNCKCQFYDCFLTANMTFTTSSAIAYSADLDGTLIPNVDVVTAKILRNGTMFASSRPMLPTNDQYVEGGTWVASYDGVTPFGALFWELLTGGIFGTCVRGQATAGNNIRANSFNVVAGNSYYIKCEMKLNSGAAFIQAFVKGTGNVIPNNFASLLVTGEWVTVHLFGAATNTGGVDIWCDAVGGSIDVSFGACTIVQVTDFSQIQKFFNSGRHIKQLKQSVPQATASPAGLNTINSYVGARVINSASAVGQPKQWDCTVAGNPGTWVSEGNL